MLRIAFIPCSRTILRAIEVQTHQSVIWCAQISRLHSTEKNNKVQKPTDVSVKNNQESCTHSSKQKDAVLVEDQVDDIEVQPEWLSLEKRLAFRKTKMKGNSC